MRPTKLMPLAALTLMLVLVSPAIAADYTVVVDEMVFGEMPAELYVGDTITWRNDDMFRHSATADDQSFDVDLPVGAESIMTLTVAGEWSFICKFHPGMTGTLVVLP
ncbi:MULTISPECIES: cupredoxin domain-containing protein [Devosia]|uniref:cupredoxin domain-containing protein n=1 Tax=Devosia TaxID=46913 RepID=UPI002735D1AA|nr:cupredoxin domain-containing protein [Devosia sp.]MDP2782008.1 cupredoxin domain-containing protein [Devosia sp.]